MDNITSQYWKRHEEYVYNFCFSLLGKESEAVIATCDVYRMFQKIMQVEPNELNTDANVKAFLSKNAMNYCFERLRYLHHIKKVKWYNKLYKFLFK